MAWFFGAGSSVSAGVPSAYDLTWDFKRRIYSAEQSYPLHLFRNLTDSGIRQQIQNYFDAQGLCPSFDSSEEYSYYFERAFASARDRSDYIAHQTSGMQLTYGHKVMGILMKKGLLNLIFTTNFDKAFENVANSKFERLEEWYAADLSSGDNGLKFFQSGKRPLIVKLHGDYFSDQLKNTTAELQEQDRKLRDILSISLDTNGLCVMGYSGRDKSIMDVLKNAAIKGSSFAGGLFWFAKAGAQPLPEVLELIDIARSNGKQAEVIQIETFDTAWADIIKAFDSLTATDLEIINQGYQRISNQPMKATGLKYPLIRLNAVPILKYPATARLFECDAGNTKELKELVTKTTAQLLVIRKKSGVVGYGADEEFIETFKKYGDYKKDIFTICEKDLMYDDSAVKGLLTAALQKALLSGTPLLGVKRRERYIIYPDPKKTDDPLFAPLKSQFSKLSGKINNSRVNWVVAVEIQIQYLLSKPLLVLTPTILASRTTERVESKLVAPFIKEETATWYNTRYDQILTSWLDVFFAGTKQKTFSAYANTLSGVNASFEISRTTAFTRTN
ncbi:MAG: SIR2 family protein [Candidatus Kuenenia stuttgartiensis]|nr:SIR2 family protein [Candidatus Kuenenia stuttgartiensis]